MIYPITIQSVTLTVNDLSVMSDYYVQLLGMHIHHSDKQSVQLGTQDKILMHLQYDPLAKRAERNEAGLFHTAFLLPSRADLGCWIKHATELNIPIHGASDHLVSEAIYLSDPEGNGIEIYVDRPSEEWHWTDDMVEMENQPFDFHSVIDEAEDDTWQGIPDNTIIGHVHLKVGSIPAAEEFFTDIMGLDITCRYSGGTFFSSGKYHHHFAANTWASNGASPRKYPVTGLANIDVLVHDSELFEIIATNGSLVAGQANMVSLRDPWNTSFTFHADDQYNTFH